MNFKPDPNPQKAHFINKNFYLNSDIFAFSKKRIFLNNPLYIGHELSFNQSENFHPISLMPGFLDEHIILYFKNHSLSRILTNVCTHRAHLILDKPCNKDHLKCPYHGRKFNSRGYIKNAIGFDMHKKFHKKNENLRNYDFFIWNGFYFTCFNNNLPDNIFKHFSKELNWYPFHKLRPEFDSDQDFELKAHWALYIENYLEGFHIPFIHKDLAKEIKSNDYRIELLPNAIIQTATSKSGNNTFKHFQNVSNKYKNLGAIYIWIYPNTMINIYPWGISLNLIIPQSKEKTIIHYESFVFKNNKEKIGAGGNLGTVEMEDQHAILKVQNGLKSNSYSPGKISPVHEIGIHHFHQLISHNLED